MSAGTRRSRATQDYSNRIPAATALGVAGGALLIAADLSTLITVRVGGRTVQSVTGHAQHDWAILLLGALSVLIGVAALRLRSTAPLLALTAIGLAVVLIAMIGDLPDVRATGPYGPSLAPGSDHAGAGFWLELAGGAVLLLGAGWAFIWRAGRSGGAPAARRRPRDEELSESPSGPTGPP